MMKLPSGGGLCGGGDLRHLRPEKGARLYCSLSDLQDYFYSIGLPGGTSIAFQFALRQRGHKPER